MTSSPPNSVTTSELEPVLSTQQLGEVTTQQLGEAATQQGLAVPLSLEMDVLYDPLQAEGGTRATEAYVKTEYDLFSRALSMVWMLIILVLLLFTD